MAATSEVLIGDAEGEHVLVRPLFRTHPGLFDFSDGNWIYCEIEIRAGGFRGSFRADLRSEEFLEFMQELSALGQTLQGAASFTTVEGQLALSLAADESGVVRMTGEARDAPGAGNRLQFTFDLDHTYLPDITSSVDHLLAAFPVVGVPG